MYILFVQSILGWRECSLCAINDADFSQIESVLLRRHILLDRSRHAEIRQILVRELEVGQPQILDDFRARPIIKPVVMLTFHVDDEVEVALLGALRHRL